VLEGRPLDNDLARALAALPGEDVLELVALANRVRNRFAPAFQACSIINAKSGQCSEDCRFCAQSAAHDTAAETYPLVATETILAAAGAAYAAGVRSFCIVTSGYGVLEETPDFRRVLATIDALHRLYPDLGVSASLGILSAATARQLAEHRIEHYNINLQTAPARYRALIAESHPVEARMATIRLLKGHGVTVCSGGIFGIGETPDDRLGLACALRDLAVDIIPLNILVPIPGTPLERQPVLPAVEVARTVALFRLINPRAVIKLAAGRETVLNDFQGLLMLAGANGFITGGYLTTRGRDVARDDALRRHLADFGPAPAPTP